MDPLSITLLIFAFMFLSLYLWRIRKRSITVSSVVVSVKEGRLEVLDRFSPLIFYFPIIQYEYCLNGKKYTGKSTRKDSRRYRVQDVDFYGMENSDDKYFWRSLKKGDKVDIEVNKWNYNDSWLSLGETDTNKSETKMFLAAGVLFFLLFLFLEFV